jgi:penicillin-binding protein 2
MYDRRVRIFIAVNLVLVLVCLLRLLQMQWLRDSSIQADIDRLKQQQLRSTQLKTIRGSILDRKGRVLAEDTPQFQITLSYKLSCYADKRVQAEKRLIALKKTSNPSGVDIENEIADKREQLLQIIADCNEFGVAAADVVQRISQVNNSVWNQRTFLAWARNDPDPNLVAKYDGRKASVPQSEAFPDFEQRFPDPETQFNLIRKVPVNDVREATIPFAIVDLATDDDLFKAQVLFLDINDVQVASMGNRVYPYGSTAAQTIGWVGGVPKDTKLFKDDPLARYLETGDVSGREDGVEYACEAILRGRRGEVVSDIDKSLVSETQPEFGRDVQLTIDIELQRQIEEYITDPARNPNYDSNTAAVVIDIRSGDILAMVSLPTYDLNRIRNDYNEVSHSPVHPLINRTINALYPPGSVVKPLILAAGLQSNAIQANEPISCPHEAAPPGWPDCLIWRKGGAHDWLWASLGSVNDARHAIQGSCNVYFSRLADRLNPRSLQEWLFKFGYGHQILGKFDVESAMEEEDVNHPPSAIRLLKESAGQLGSTTVPGRPRITSTEQIPPLNPAERRYFGIGQGNLRVTPLQVANSFAALARGGQYVSPRLFKSETRAEPVDLGISPVHLQVIHDGLSAVVNEPHGSAYEAFRAAANDDSPTLTERGVKVYGKTGSTERPFHAWFAGFAEDATGARVALAVVVEGGEHGSDDAAPIARHILHLCAQAGYVGK